MGAAEGGVMPISHAMVASEVAPEHRGIAQGVAQNFGSNLLGSFAAPVLLVWFATAFGWREAFFLAGVPGLVSVALIWWLIREPEMAKPPTAEAGEVSSWLEVLRVPNVLLCCALAILLVSYLVICWAFMPLYLTQVRGLSPESMGWLMGTLGISATIGSFAVTGLSDRIGRRPVMIAMPLVGIILPLGALYLQGSLWFLAAIFFLGWGWSASFPCSWRRYRRKASTRARLPPRSAFAWAPAKFWAACCRRRSPVSPPTPGALAPRSGSCSACA
jgi:predicted MFS family arabinose efflux permease